MVGPVAAMGTGHGSPHATAPKIGVTGSVCGASVGARSVGELPQDVALQSASASRWCAFCIVASAEHSAGLGFARQPHLSPRSPFPLPLSPESCPCPCPNLSLLSSPHLTHTNFKYLPSGNAAGVG
jgi:hypothetical protein